MQMLTPAQQQADAELAAKVRRDARESTLREAIYALNGALAAFSDTPAGDPDYHALTSVRDRAWQVGVRAFGWRD